MLLRYQLRKARKQKTVLFAADVRQKALLTHWKEKNKEHYKNFGQCPNSGLYASTSALINSTSTCLLSSRTSKRNARNWRIQRQRAKWNMKLAFIVKL